MANNTEKLNLFFDKIKNLTFWQRLFGWKALRSLSYDAYEEYSSMQALASYQTEAIHTADTKVSNLENDIVHLNSKINHFERESKEYVPKITKLASENSTYRANEEDRVTQHETRMIILDRELNRISDERNAEQEKKIEEANQLHEDMKETWSRHQIETEKEIRRICLSNTIDYIDKIPFKGKPDNTLKICNEFVIFDAKSPASDDLTNFPIYIKNQTEAVKKYIKEDCIRKDIFFVIPLNTVDVIDKYCYDLADYRVYVVTLNALEPLILTLKKIESYEFMEQMTPEERENICRLVGKFAHLTKRRIQIDSIFSWEFLNLLTKCETDLPKEIIDSVYKFERAEKFNPPMERRSKQILTQDLKRNSEKLLREAEGKGIDFPPSLRASIKNLPLYKEDKSK